MSAAVKSRETSVADLAKAAALGLGAGLTATWVMSQLQKLFSPHSGRDQEQESKAAQSEEPEPSPTEVVADKISTALRGRPVSESHKALAGQIVHYSFGTSLGGLYGLACEIEPKVMKTYGLVWGTGVMVLADEVALPLLKLTRPPQEYPASVHLSALGAHLVYGLTTDLAYRGLQKLTESEIPERWPAYSPAEEQPARLDCADFVATGA